MPQVILSPSGAGDSSGWTAHGAATLWQALADALASSYAHGEGAGTGFRVVCDALPAEAATVSRVTVVAAIAGDDLARCQHSIRLAGVESHGTPVVPPDGGTVLFSASFDTAPGGLPWTVARVNALQPGLDQLDDAISANGMTAESMSLAVDYEPAITTVPPGPIETITFPASHTATDAFPDASGVSVAAPDDSMLNIVFPDSNPVDSAMPVTVKGAVEMTGER